jgi:MoaA/NifB/PqqE/SkfB family radical SAM enzyme
MSSGRSLTVLAPDRAPVAAENSDRTKGLLRLTMSCNERCPFCNVPFEDYAVRTPPESEIAAQLDAFVLSGEKTLTISGGEPTLLRKRLVRLVTEARARGILLIELQTNAVRIDPTYAAELAAAGVTSAFVSLLSDVAELHDTLAGLPGAFEPCLRGIDALLAHGIRVTLNPVIAHVTQERVADYVDFVASRLPGIESISLSAVQPHGRAAKHPELMPDYAVLASSVREARARAARHGIRLLNPYCGLPLCIGWDDDEGRARSVEAIEAREERGATFETLPGIENHGDKAHGPPCLGCAVRTRCGGAWHAYWSHRGGSGIAAPLARVEPWDQRDTTSQRVVRALDDARGASEATIWLRTHELALGDAARILRSDVTDLALDLTTTLGAATLRELVALRDANARRPSQGRVRVAARLTQGAANLTASHRVLRALAEAGVESVRVVPASSDRAAQARWSVVRDALAIEAPRLVVRIEGAG